MKPYRSIPIKECGEPLVAIPKGEFAFFDPHAYIAAGAPYHGVSPWMLRQGVLQALERAQENLQTRRAGWKIMLFDCYRPHTVQAYMVAREFNLLAKEAGLDPAQMPPAQRDAVYQRVFRLWGEPSDDPKSPPPHSTGGVVDCTLADEKGEEVDMGSPVDENSDRSSPDYFAAAKDEAGKRAHANRVLLNDIMRVQGFHRMDNEWWHFAKGDQWWAWIEHGSRLDPAAYAVYGRADLL